jgi:hypothetical protein
VEGIEKLIPHTFIILLPDDNTRKALVSFDFREGLWKLLVLLLL